MYYYVRSFTFAHSAIILDNEDQDISVNTINDKIYQSSSQMFIAQLAGAVEYTNCFSA